MEKNILIMAKSLKWNLPFPEGLELQHYAETVCSSGTMFSASVSTNEKIE